MEKLWKNTLIHHIAIMGKLGNNIAIETLLSFAGPFLEVQTSISNQPMIEPTTFWLGNDLFHLLKATPCFYLDISSRSFMVVFLMKAESHDLRSRFLHEKYFMKLGFVFSVYTCIHLFGISVFFLFFMHVLLEAGCSYSLWEIYFYVNKRLQTCVIIES